MNRERLFRAAVVVFGLAVLWTVLVMWTDGTVFYVAGTRISSRSPRNPAILTLLSLVAAWLLAPAGQRNQTVGAECSRLLERVARRLPSMPTIPRVAQVIVAVAAVSVFIVGMTFGAFVIGGSDSYGYVSQAHLWTTGQIRQQPVLSGPLAPEVSLTLLTPLGYRPTIDGTTIAPTYSSGLPIVMAIFETLFGPNSVFWVVPIFAAVLVWLTYLLGTRVQGPITGTVAAVLLATSPPFLHQLTTAPMSDLPAGAWWTLALVLIPLERRATTFAAGMAAGMAILTRPNLVPLLAVVAGFLLWRLFAARRSRWHVLQHALLFACCPIPTCIAIAVLNRALWGSTLQSGYGSLTDLYDVENIRPTLLLYLRVLVVQMPVILLVPVAWFVRRGWLVRDNGDRPMSLALGAFTVVVVGAYSAYPVFDSEWNLRFLLPAIPVLLVLSSVAALSLAGRLVETHRVMLVALLVIVTGYGVDQARDIGSFETGHLRRFATIGEYIARRLPERAVLLAMLHSGSATYYSGRPTVRYDLIAPTDLDGLIKVMTKRGYVPYLLLDADERAQFQSRYLGYSRLGALDWPPLIGTMKPPDVQLYAVPVEP